MAETKVRDERYLISKKKGNGQIRREVWIDEHGKVTHYNLAYINHQIFSGDNGRVLGYDNKHGRHHRHYMGVTRDIELSSLEELEEHFDKEWNKLIKDVLKRT
jgi:hypothetical protein